MTDIQVISTNHSFVILASAGIKVHIVEPNELEETFKQVIEEKAKIIIYESSAEAVVLKLMDKEEESLYPIYLKMPTGDPGEDTLSELKNLIEKSIGISII